jgi:transcriptional regulator with XRE-family HTH domain
MLLTVAMSTSHLGRAVAFICTTKGTTQTQIAAHAGLSQVILSRACSGTRPEVRSLRALCTCQPDPRDNLDLLVAHLRDEIERAGHSTADIEIAADCTQIDDDLRLLLEEAKNDQQLSGMLHQLAAFVRTHPLRPENEVRYPRADDEPDTTQAAAEDEQPYDAP